MKRACWLSMLLLAGAMSSASQAAPERAGDFALLDQNGEFHQFSRLRHKDAVVLFSHDSSCAAANSAVTDLQNLRNRWESENVAFMMIDASKKADYQAVREATRMRSVNFPVMVDTTQLVAETLGISQAGEVLVLDPEALTVLYRGPVHQKLDETLGQALGGNVEETVVMDVEGCDLTLPLESMASAPDYATEVAPIITENCASCHRDGGIGPFAMDSHLMVQGWSPMIRETLLTKRMPPMQVDPTIGHFSNANYLSDEDLQTLITWIDSGSPRGDEKASDPLVGLEFPPLDEWQMGEPDYIVKAPNHHVPATGVLDYINIDVDLPFEEDKWVKAVQYIPGDETVLHHLLTYVTAPAEDFDGGEADTRSSARRFLEGYAPGKVEVMQFPEDTGVWIPKGHKLSMQFHYTTSGRETNDETLLGLYMHDEVPKHENLTRSVSGRFRIPPNAIDHKARAEYTFDEDVVVNGLRAHMHFRGTDMKFAAEYPDGTMEDLLSVPNYSYAWQPTFQLAEPKRLPAGTKVHVTGAFDNSEFNPANPDPDKEITFGLQTWDEMFIGYWTYYADE